MISRFYTQDVTLLDDPLVILLDTDDLEILDSDGLNIIPETYWSTSTGAYSVSITIKAAVNRLSAEEQFKFDRLGYNGQFKVYADPTTEVYAGRRAEWNGKRYEIVNKPKNTLKKNHHIRFILKAVQ